MQDIGVRAKIDGLGNYLSGMGQMNQAVQGHAGFLKMAATSAIGFGVAMLGIQGIKGVFDGITSAAIGFNSQLEQASISFTVMTGSAELAQTTLNELKDFAAETPFDFPDLLEGSTRLMAYGTEAKNLIPTLEILGNIAAGVGRDKMPELILAFGQVQSATRLTGQELRQFINAGVPLLEGLALHFDQPVAAIQKMVETGKVGFKDVITVLAGLSDEGGKFGNLMQLQSRTFSGAMSNIKDVLRFTVADGFEPFFDRLRDMTIALGDWLLENKRVITTVLVLMANEVTVTMDHILAVSHAAAGANATTWKGWAQTVVATFLWVNGQIRDIVADIAHVVAGLGRTIDVLKNSVSNFSSDLSSNLQRTGDIGAAFGLTMGTAFKDVGQAAYEAIDTTQNVTLSWEDANAQAGRLTGGVESLTGVIEEQMSALRKWGPMTADQAKQYDSLEKQLDSLTDTQGSNRRSIQDLLDSIGGSVAGGGGGGGLTGGLKKAAGAAKEAKSALQELEVSEGTLRQAMEMATFGTDEQRAVLEALGVAAIDAGPLLDGLSITAERLSAAFLRAGLSIDATHDAIGRIQAVIAKKETDRLAEIAQREVEEAERERQRLEEEAKRQAEELERRTLDIGELMKESFGLEGFDKFAESAIGSRDIITDEAQATLDDWRRQYFEFNRDIALLFEDLKDSGTLGAEETVSKIKGIIAGFEALPDGLQEPLSDIKSNLESMLKDFVLTSDGAVDLVSKNHKQMMMIEQERIDELKRVQKQAFDERTQAFIDEAIVSQKAAELLEKEVIAKRKLNAEIQSSIIAHEREAALRRQEMELEKSKQAGLIERAIMAVTSPGKAFGLEDLGVLQTVAKEVGVNFFAFINALRDNATVTESLLGLVGSHAYGAQQSLVPLPLSAAAGAMGATTNYYLNANYTNTQEPQSLKMDLEAIALLAGR